MDCSQSGQLGRKAGDPFYVLFRHKRCFPFLDNVATSVYIGPMKEVGIRELKNRLSEYIRLVREGEVVMVTDRGEVVAELRAPQVAAQPKDLDVKV